MAFEQWRHRGLANPFRCAERAFGAFARSMPLPPGVDPGQVKATFKNGILEVHLRKTKESKGRKIEIQAE